MLYEIFRNGLPVFKHEIHGARTQGIPIIDYVDIEFDYYSAVLLKKNDTIFFEANTFYCDNRYNSVVKIGRNNYRHKARFVAEYYIGTEIALLNSNGDSIFEIEANLNTLVNLAISNFNRISSGWLAYPVPNTVTKLFSINNESVNSFLARISGEFEIPFQFLGQGLKFGDIYHEEGSDFAYGKGNGFTELTKSYRSEITPNTIYVSGGDGLFLDEPIIDQQNINENGIIEGFYSNDRIVATTRAQVTGSITQNNILGTNQINYILNDYLIQGQRAWINFETGALAGLSFYVEQTYKEDDVTIIKFIPRLVDGVMMPSDTLKPQNGDYFNITNITQPEEVINEAKIRLRIYATDHLRKLINRSLVLDAKVDPLSNKTPILNNKIFIKDLDLKIDDYFYVSEVKTYLQELQRREIKISHNNEWNLNLNLPVVNDNLINIGIDTNYNDLVRVEENDRFNIKIDRVNILDRDFELEYGKTKYKFGDGVFKIGSKSLIVDDFNASDIKLPSKSGTLSTGTIVNGQTYFASKDGLVDLGNITPVVPSEETEVFDLFITPEFQSELKKNECLITYAVAIKQGKELTVSFEIKKDNPSIVTLFSGGLNTLFGLPVAIANMVDLKLANFIPQMKMFCSDYKVEGMQKLMYLDFHNNNIMQPDEIYINEDFVSFTNQIKILE